jgi:hypothetical protein
VDAEIADPGSLLEGIGKFMRHVNSGPNVTTMPPL